MRRRRFLQTGALALGAWSAGWPKGRSEEPTSGEPKAKPPAPRFRFLQLNDPHVQAPIPETDKDPNLPTYERANERMRWMVEAIQMEKPDFVLGVGDLIHGERLERLPLDLKFFREMIQPLHAPFYPGLGNHEVVQREGNPTYEKPYREAFGQERVNYTFLHGGLLFIMLNNSGAAMSVTEEARKARNRWLEGILDREKAVPKVLCCHVPLLPVREEAVLAKSFGWPSYTAQDADLLKLVRAHAGTILAVLSGHIHLTGVVQDRGVYHIVPSGLASYPHDYALFEVFDNRIHVQMKTIPQKLAVPNTNIHRPRRDKVVFTDKDHPTHELYIKGNATEREWDIARVQPPAQGGGKP